MKREMFQKRYGALSRSRLMWVGLSGVLLASNVFLSLGLFFKEDRVILVSPTFGDSERDKPWIENNTVSPVYLEEMAGYFVHLAMDVSPESAAYQHTILLKNVWPSKYSALKAQLMAEVEILKKDNISTVFMPIEAKVRKDGTTVELQGVLSTYVGGKRISEVEKTFEVSTQIQKGRLYLTGLEAKI